MQDRKRQDPESEPPDANPVEDRLADLFAAAGVNRFLGFELVRASAEGAELRLPVRSELLQERGVVQGGIQTALADTACVYALLGGSERDFDEYGIAGVELKLNFLRPARADGSALVARSRPIRRGRRLAVVRVELEQDGRAVADGIFTYLFVEP